MKSHLEIFRPVLLALVLGLCAGSPPLSAATTHFVYIKDIAFNPYDLTIAAGDTVTWICQESTHTVSPSGGTSEAFCGTGYLFNGDNCSQTFNSAGDFYYRCLVHSGFYPAMNGVIRVTALPNNVLPTISLTRPANAARIGAFFTFEAAASDSDGTVKQVEFRYGPDALSVTNSFGIVTNSTLLTNNLYQFIATNNLPHGDYTLVAKVTDDRGGEKVSTAITVTIGTQLTAPEFGLTTNAAPAFQLLVSITPGSNHVVQATTNLAGTNNWVSLFTNTASTNRFYWQDTSFTNTPFRFYRVLQTP
ncbi:MAG: hypothetical protein HZA89_10935 [Verrucomicrobia bacterium]|nr:hypothetical protein [Verrucomicrobiota bacterium]